MIKPKLALVPSAYKGGSPKGTLYSVLPSDGVGDFDFERAGEATRINKDGLIELVDSNVPRLNYPLIDGVVSGCPSLLLEPERTNLVTNSNDFTSWLNSGSYITADYGISPDGTLNASRCLFTNTNQAIQKNIGTNGTLSYSIYVKGVKGETINISMASGSDDSFTLNGEWQRLSYSDTVTNSTLNINTFGGKTARDLLIFGVQLEQGSYPTSYIPTQGSIGTRVAESCNQTVPDGIIGQTEGTVFLDSKMALQSINNYQLFSINNGGGSDRIRILTATSNRLRFIYQLDGGTTFYSFYTSTGYSDLTNLKIAFTYKSGDIKVYINGVLADSSTNTFTIAEKLIDIDIATSAGGYNQMLFNDIKLYDTALTDQELINLTTI